MPDNSLYILFSGGTLLVSTLTGVGGYIYGGKNKKSIDECERNRASCQTDFKSALKEIREEDRATLKEMREEDRKVHSKLFDMVGSTNKEVSEIAGGLRAQGIIK